MLELARHRKALAEGREDNYPDTWVSYSTLAAMRE
jgi:hypothetical protein